VVVALDACRVESGHSRKCSGRDVVG
jgi:hypothetical protein